MIGASPRCSGRSRHSPWTCEGCTRTMYLVPRFVLERVSATTASLGMAFAHLGARAAGSVRTRVGRRRLSILVLGALACGYAAYVLSHVVSSPDIGIDFSLTPEIYEVHDEFFGPASADFPKPGDRVIRLGRQDVESWAQLLRGLSSLREFEFQAEGTSLDAVTRDNPNASYVRIGTDDWVKVQYRSATNEVSKPVVWCRVGRQPI